VRDPPYRRGEDVLADGGSNSPAVVAKLAMAIDFSLPPELEELRAKTTAFIAEVVIPREREAQDATHGVDDAFRRELQASAKERGLLSPAARVEWGGLGLDLRGCAVVFEEAGYSLIGPLAMNCAAPDEGNMNLLEKVATPAQQRRYLAPLVAGEHRSSFAMTEPAPGAGSDPVALLTTATRDGDTWVIEGHKWFITGADGAGFFICMAKTEEVDGRVAATMFLVDADNPGVELVRRVGSIDTVTPGGHCELRFHSCVVPADAVLGEVHKGFEYAQVRLNPARLTHCMRWLGVARRARDVANEYVTKRSLFGQSLASLGLAQQHIADNEIDLAAARALLWQACWTIDSGQPANAIVAATKVFVAEAAWRVVDRSVQLCGAYGVSDDSGLGWMLRELRPFRIYDGASEVHRWSLARRTVRGGQSG
jgi:acyl-CoA dehydrogenase